METHAPTETIQSFNFKDRLDRAYEQSGTFSLYYKIIT